MRGNVRYLTKYAVLSVLLATLMPAAIVVYDNGAPNGVGGAEMTQYMEADDVTPSSDITFNTLRFWTVEPAGGAAYNGTIVWVINLNTGGNFPHFLMQASSPGAINRSYSRTLSSGAFAGYDEYQIDLSLVTPVTLSAANTYWFSLHNGSYGPLNMTNESFYWQTTDANATYSSHNFDWLASGAPGPWVANGGTPQLAYQLLLVDTPEPGTWSMLVAGAAALVGLRRRRRVSN
jgi:hypothetical protein